MSVISQPVLADCWFAAGSDWPYFFSTPDAALDSAIARIVKLTSICGISSDISRGPAAVARLLTICEPCVGGDGPCQFYATTENYSVLSPELISPGLPCQHSSIIKISSQTDPSTHGAAYVTDVAPSGTLDSTLVTKRQLVAMVVDEQNKVVPNVNVKIELKAVVGSGGHNHDQSDPARPLGSLNGQASTSGYSTPITGKTDLDGFQFEYESPEVSGDYKIVASCTDRTCTQKGPDTIWVGIPDLVSIPSTSVYSLVGSDSYHPANHYLSNQALAAVTILATLYHGMFPTEPATGLVLNDSSLERGGLFDIYFDYTDTKGIVHQRTTWWVTPHKEHRLGVVVDVRANPKYHPDTAIPRQNDRAFEKLIKAIGGNFLHENIGGSNEHYHIRLLGIKG